MNWNNIEDIRHDTMNGREYLVAPVTAMKAMHLDGGYVPKRHIEKSAPAWNGTPVTLYHPVTAEGDRISANNPEIADKVWLGYFFNTEVNDDELNGEVWLDVNKATDMGGEAEALIKKLENGEGVAVSTSYYGDRLEPGDYDGERRNEVVGNLKPDHLAMLPSSDGVCSIEDGCMAGLPAMNDEYVSGDDFHECLEEVEGTGSWEAVFDALGDTHEGLHETMFHVIEHDIEMTYNSVMYQTMATVPYANVLSEARTPNYEGTETTSWEDVSRSLDEIASALDIPADIEEMGSEGRERIANLTLLGDPNADTFDDLYFFPVVNHNNMNLNEGALQAVLGGRGQQADISSETYNSAANVAERLLDEEFTEETNDNLDPETFGQAAAAAFAESLSSSEINNNQNMSERQNMISVLVNEHGFKEESLEEMGDTCLELTYQSFENEEVEEEAEEDEPDYVTEKEISEIIRSEITEALAANQEEKERKTLIEKILKNSDEYEQEELEQTPIGVLENMADDVDEVTVDYTGVRGANESPSEDWESFPSLTVNGDD